VEAIDTTGCGDVFHAGFIYGLLKNWNIDKCFDFAAWAAAMVSLKLGGRVGIPTLEDWNQVLNKVDF
jgi:sulfofructose kinase